MLAIIHMVQCSLVCLTIMLIILIIHPHPVPTVNVFGAAIWKKCAQSLGFVRIRFLSWVNCHGNGGLGPVRNPILVTVALLNPDVGVVIGTVTRLGCVCEEILVTVDGFGAAIWKRCAQ